MKMKMELVILWSLLLAACVSFNSGCSWMKKKYASAAESTPGVAVGKGSYVAPTDDKMVVTDNDGKKHQLEAPVTVETAVSQNTSPSISATDDRLIPQDIQEKDWQRMWQLIRTAVATRDQDQEVLVISLVFSRNLELEAEWHSASDAKVNSKLDVRPENSTTKYTGKQ